MKLVGSRERSEFELDPQIAWRRGKALDALLRATMPPYQRGVWRLTHAQMNQLDLERQRLLAARIDQG